MCPPLTSNTVPPPAREQPGFCMLLICTTSWHQTTVNSLQPYQALTSRSTFVLLLVCDWTHRNTSLLSLISTTSATLSSLIPDSMRFLWFFLLKSCFGFEPVWSFLGGGSVFIYFFIFLTPQHANLARWALIANLWSVLAANGSFFRCRLKKVKWPFFKVEKVRKWKKKKKKQSSVPLVTNLMHALWQRPHTAAPLFSMQSRRLHRKTPEKLRVEKY